MKNIKLLTLLLALVMVLSLCACGKTETPAASASDIAEAAPEKQPEPEAEEEPAEAPKAPEAVEVRGVTVPAFAVTVNGIEVNNDMMAAYPVYSVEVTTTNSSGTVSTTTYAGFAMADVLDAAGLTEQYIWLEATADDGYAVEYTGDIFSNLTLLAINQNGTQFKSSPWFAPCASETTGDYLKGCVSILVNTVEGAPEIKVEAKEGEAEEGELELVAPDKQDKTEKVTFGDYCFKVNGKDVKNADLDGLSIYKIKVVTENSKGTRSESSYTGYLLSDVMEKLGLTGTVKAVADDGYESELTAEQTASEFTLIAIEKDKETGKNGTVWVAPCEESSSSAYCKGVVEITVG